MKILFIILFVISFNLVSSSCGNYKDCSEIWKYHVFTNPDSICNNMKCIVRGRYIKPKCFRDTCCIFLTMDRYDTNPFLSDKDISRWLYKYRDPHFIIKVDTISECDMDTMYNVFDIIAEKYNLKPTSKISEDGTYKRDICVRKVEQRIGKSGNPAIVEYPLIMDNDYNYPYKC